MVIDYGTRIGVEQTTRVEGPVPETGRVLRFLTDAPPPKPLAPAYSLFCHARFTISLQVLPLYLPREASVEEGSRMSMKASESQN
jgi:hypothetical protein